MDSQDIRDILDGYESSEDSEEEKDINEDEESTGESSSNDDNESGNAEEDAGCSGPGQVRRKLPQDVGSTRLASTIEPKEGNNNCSSLLSWKNETLYPPTKKRKISNPSPVWKFGGFKKGDEPLNIITCGLCGKTYEYKNNSPGNFGNHLKSDHEEEWKKQDLTTNNKK